MKKCMLMALITIFALVSVATLCSADSRRGLTNTSKKGSLLVYPLIKVGEDVGGNDTIVFIANDYPGKVRVRCQYAWPEGCACDRFSFTLTANQSIAFSARTGLDVDDQDLPRKVSVDRFPGPDVGQYVGELRCWAVDAGMYPISWNHLYGSATVVEGTDQTWEYSAWRFAVGYGVTRGSRVRDAQGNPTMTLRLTGMPTTYDACPERLIFNFIKQVADPEESSYPEGEAENRLTLVPCKQDCVSSPAQATFLIYDENEADDDASACYDCDDNASAIFAKSLSDSTKFQGADAFGSDHDTPGGMAIVVNQPGYIPQYRCADPPVPTYGIPFLGVISNKFSGSAGPVAGESLTTLGRAQPYLTINGVRTDIEVQMNSSSPSP